MNDNIALLLLIFLKKLKKSNIKFFLLIWELINGLITILRFFKIKFDGFYNILYFQIKLQKKKESDTLQRYLHLKRGTYSSEIRYFKIFLKL